MEASRARRELAEAAYKEALGRKAALTELLQQVGSRGSVVGQLVGGWAAASWGQQAMHAFLFCFVPKLRGSPSSGSPYFPPCPAAGAAQQPARLPHRPAGRAHTGATLQGGNGGCGCGWGCVHRRGAASTAGAQLLPTPHPPSPRIPSLISLNVQVAEMTGRKGRLVRSAAGGVVWEARNASGVEAGGAGVVVG